MKNFNWQFTFKRFIIGFLLLNIIFGILQYYHFGNFNIPKQNLTQSFTFALLYALFSSYMNSKNNQQ